VDAGVEVVSGLGELWATAEVAVGFCKPGVAWAVHAVTSASAMKTIEIRLKIIFSSGKGKHGWIEHTPILQPSERIKAI